jgi:hypothetical protein
VCDTISTAGENFIGCVSGLGRAIADLKHSPNREGRFRDTPFYFEQGNPMTKTVLIAAAFALALAGCSDSNKAAADKAAADAKAAAEKAAAATKEAADKAAAATKDAADKAAAATKDAAQQAADATKDAMKSAAPADTTKK